MLKYKNPIDWIYDHTGTKVSFKKVINSIGEYDFVEVIITMELPYKKISENGDSEPITIQRNTKFLLTNYVLIDTLDEMYHEGLSLN